MLSQFKYFLFIMILLTIIFTVTIIHKIGMLHITGCTYISNRTFKGVSSNGTDKKDDIFNVHATKSNILQGIGLGEDGRIVNVPRNEENYGYLRKQFLQKGVNNFLSDLIGIKRVLPDKRPGLCKDIKYRSDLPEVSIVIIFRDEPVTSLLRTFYSILQISPSSVLKEIILVDDGSKDKYLKTAVSIHVANEKKATLLRNENSLGLMMARQKGIEAAESNYVIVFDGHIEVTPGWLEPILDRLVDEPNVLLTSNVLWIDREDFRLKQGHHFDYWHLFFDQITLKEDWLPYTSDFRQTRNNSVAPIEYAIIPGSMIAIRKEYFLQLGGFDPGMKVWGIEHIELSVKVWLCGGRVEMVPCSIIGHLYRLVSGSNFQFFDRNKARFVKVWMDGDLRELALEVLNKSNVSHVQDSGDVRDRLRIKAKNKCKPYQFFIDQVEKISEPFIPQNLRMKGFIRNTKSGDCLTYAKREKKLILITQKCTGNVNQFSLMSDQSRIRIYNAWLTADVGELQLKLKQDIPNWSDNKKIEWRYNGNGSVTHILTGMCLTGSDRAMVSTERCIDSSYQIWQWSIK